MKYSLSLIFLLCFPAFILQGQSQRAVMTLDGAAGNSRTGLPVYEIPLQDVKPFLSYFVRWEGQVQPLEIRFSADGVHWTGWQALERDEHAPELPLSARGSTAATNRFFQLRGAGEDFRVQCHFFSPGPSEGLTPSETLTGGRSCPADLPPFFQRKDWCPGGTCREHPNPAYTDVTHLVIHHSAGENESDDWAAVVRAIWDFHVNGRGWSDIGYNWLIDPEGNIYQGRGNDVIGAHYCGANTGTMGVCLLGNFTTVRPTEAAVATLEDLLYWKVCALGLDPMAISYHRSSRKDQPVIIGHRDGCATACPGDMFYPLIPDVRENLAARSTTPTQEAARELGIRLFPNPAIGGVFLHLGQATAGRYQVRITDGLGRSLSQQQTIEHVPGHPPHPVRLNGPAAGWYLLSLTHPDGHHTTLPLLLK